MLLVAGLQEAFGRLGRLDFAFQAFLLVFLACSMVFVFFLNNFFEKTKVLFHRPFDRSTATGHLHLFSIHSSAGMSAKPSRVDLTSPLSSSSSSSSAPTTLSSSEQDDAHGQKLLLCGLISGLTCSFVFNPWDRALFLSVTYHRPFMHIENFRSPMEGVFQSITQRALSSGMYFPLEEIFERRLRESSAPTSAGLQVLVAGMCAGAINALVLNPLSSIKYHMWSSTTEGHMKMGMWMTAQDMLVKGGVRPFFIGTAATIYRDVIFGMCFAGCRHELLPYLANKETKGGKKRPEKSRQPFMLDFVSASVATAASSPFNYVRNVHYAVPSGQTAETHVKILTDLWRETLSQSTLRGRWDVFSTRLRIGWGTLRVGCGMGLASQLYSVCKSYIM